MVGVYEKGKLVYVARPRNNFTPATRAALFKKFNSKFVGLRKDKKTKDVVRERPPHQVLGSRLRVVKM
jgi:hypothetical protein